ncbi:proton-coupled zinc antiporter SLC30A1-like [Paramacrobiotus metropolitanus]|uniref:proton-coupled zinc antiporter SLC30A1-like n=1 Tax=Paramacrobiotus metropolitanus TaxID=2943436 RepID=UPI002445DD15|nr:proton-coupled zinc antiporter SLC30A1-like [Paramacrobiotus metropolitanus]
MPEPRKSHGIAPIIYTCLLLILNIAYFGASLIISYTTHCLTLRMDSNYVLFVVGSLIVSLIDMKFRNVRSLKNTFGWARIEFLGSLFNATFLASLSFSAAVESIQQLIHLAGHSGHDHGVHQDEAMTIIIFGLIRCGLAVITFSARIAMKDTQTKIVVNYTQNAGVELCVLQPSNSNGDQNSDSELRHLHKSPVLSPNLPVAVIRETVGPVTILACGLIIFFYGAPETYRWYLYVDPAICLTQLLILGLTLFHNAKESSMALMLTIPRHVNILELQKKLIRTFPRTILDVHDFHLWRSSRDHLVVTCHLICTSLADYVRASADIDCFFRGEGIEEVTIQPEVLPDTDPEINDVMTPNACACCEASPKCCSLKETSQLQDIRKRTIHKPTPEMADLEMDPTTSGDSGTDEPQENTIISVANP